LTVALGLVVAAPRLAHAADTLESVRSAGTLACGVITEEEDYSKSEAHGNLSVLGRDVCRAVAAVVLGDPAKLKLIGFPDDPHSLDAVRSGKVALAVGGTPDMANEAAFGVGFGPPVFLDGEGFLVHGKTGPGSIRDLQDRQVCYIPQTHAEDDLTDRLALRNVKVKPFPFEETGEMEAALVTGHCAAIAAPISELAGMRPGFHARVMQYEILPETITLEPFAPMFRLGDPHWAQIVAWTVNALVMAEEAGVTRSTVLDQQKTGRPEVRYLLGGTPGVGKALGLDDGWALRAIEAVGNYGEMFERDVGSGSPMRLARGHNALWTQGGMIYSPPIR
jgi:general L-amino acid transport system substrate-binding protein